MSTLDSWIDRDELAALVAELAPTPPTAAEEPPAEVSDAAAPPAEESAEPVTAGLDVSPEAGVAEPEEPSEPIPAEVPEAAEIEVEPEPSEVEAEAEIEAESAPEIEPTAEPELAEPEVVADEAGAFTEPELLGNEEAEAIETEVEAELSAEPELEMAEAESPEAEVAALIAEEAPESEPEAEAAPFEAESAPEIATMDEAGSSEEAEPEREAEIAAEEAPEPAAGDDSEVVGAEDGLNFDEPAAYEASPFPLAEIPADADEPGGALRRTAAVQAAEALERARDRAQQGGLLKLFSTRVVTGALTEPVETPVDAPVDESASEAAEEEPSSAIVEEPESQIEELVSAEVADEPVVLEELGEPAGESLDDLSIPAAEAEEEIGSEPLPVEEEELGVPIDEESDAIFEAAIDEDAESEAPAFLPLRERLRGFAGRTTLATGSGRLAITDLQGYPLLADEGGPASPHSAPRLAHWFGSLTQELKASRDGMSQVALAGGDWLCVVAAESAAGGVCASFRVAEPLSAEQARLLTEDLRSTLREPAVLTAPVEG